MYVHSFSKLSDSFVFFSVLLSFQRCAAACICLHFHVDMRCVSKRYENVPKVHFCFFRMFNMCLTRFHHTPGPRGRRIHYARWFICFLQSVFFSSLVPGTHRCLKQHFLRSAFLIGHFSCQFLKHENSESSALIVAEFGGLPIET